MGKVVETYHTYMTFQFQKTFVHPSFSSFYCLWGKQTLLPPKSQVKR